MFNSLQPDLPVSGYRVVSDPLRGFQMFNRKDVCNEIQSRYEVSDPLRGFQMFNLFKKEECLKYIRVSDPLRGFQMFNPGPQSLVCTKL